MIRYADYLSRWRERFGEDDEGEAKFYRDGKPFYLALVRLDEQAVAALWTGLLALWDSFMQADDDHALTVLHLEAMKPIEYRLLVWGRFFGRDSLVVATPKVEKKKPRKKKR